VNTNFEIIERHINALKAGALADLPIADDVKFENPITGAQSGAENFRAFLSGFLSAIKDAQVLRSVCEDDHVVAHWEVESVFGVIQILELFRVRDGLIVESNAFFDPRPVLGG